MSELSNPVGLWDAYGMFEDRLVEFEDIMARIGNHYSLLPNPLSLALEAFGKVQSYEAWGDKEVEYVTESIDVELSEAVRTRYGNGLPWIRAFTCYVDGALLGLLSGGAISDSGFMYGTMLLPTFLSEQSNRICPASF